MSKERELLREIMGYIASGVVSITSNDLGDAAETLHEIQELLAQPETKQEPVAWMYDHQLEVGYDKYTEVNIIETCARNLESNNCINIRPLYLAPPKREPLSVERIADLWTDINTNSVRNFARAIEKEHGIGGG